LHSVAGQLNPDVSNESTAVTLKGKAVLGEREVINSKVPSKRRESKPKGSV
jgi:hypothetical protein